MVKTFKLLELPILVSRMILSTIGIEEMDLTDLIAQALKSRKFRDCLLEVKKFQVDSMEFWLNQGGLRSGIVIDLGPGIFPRIFINISPLNRPIYNFKVVAQKLFIKENTYHYPLKIIHLNCEPSTELRIFEQVTKRLKPFLEIKNFYLKVSEQYDSLNFPLIKHVDKFTKIECQSDEGSFEIKSKDLDNFFENSRSDVLNISFKVIDTPRYTPKSSSAGNHQTVNITGGDWINMDTILDFDVKELKINITENCVVKINKLMKDWTSGKNERMEKWEFECMCETIIEDEPGLFEGLETQNSFFNKKHLEKLYSQFEYSTDIRRKTDGRLATILVSSTNLKMIVWTEESFSHGVQKGLSDHSGIARFCDQFQVSQTGAEGKNEILERGPYVRVPKRVPR
ncbi:hypothetical protein CAEBREN_11382 [Caenorhabditis brenneri]|uniref:Sdz-33 F-box domain-containing protein n=1 Tax=Caenorhabditis brenneri TaxID=135651 RepID=G0MIY0_CAEBE|nr:hypothetical protein CAEBREN_11382 [Caenorhabditis brenneri]